MHIRKHLDEGISEHLDASQSTEQGSALWAISEPKKRPSRLLKPKNRSSKQNATSKRKTWNLLAQGTRRACTTKRKGRQFILRKGYPAALVGRTARKILVKMRRAHHAPDIYPSHAKKSESPGGSCTNRCLSRGTTRPHRPHVLTNEPTTPQCKDAKQNICRSGPFPKKGNDHHTPLALGVSSDTSPFTEMRTHHTS